MHLSADIVDSTLGPLSHASVGVWEGTNFEFNGRKVAVEIEGDAEGPDVDLRQILDQFRRDYLRYAPAIEQAFTEADLTPADDAPLVIGHISVFHHHDGGQSRIEIMHHADHPLEEHPYIAIVENGAVTEVFMS